MVLPAEPEPGLARAAARANMTAAREGERTHEAPAGTGCCAGDRAAGPARLAWFHRLRCLLVADEVRRRGTLDSGG